MVVAIFDRKKGELSLSLNCVMLLRFLLLLLLQIQIQLAQEGSQGQGQVLAVSFQRRWGLAQPQDGLGPRAVHAGVAQRAGRFAAGQGLGE